MKRWGEASYEPAELSAQAVLANVESAVLVADRLGNVLYANAYAEGLFGLTGTAYVGKSVLSLGIEDEDREQAAELARRVLRGHPWEGTFATARPDGSKAYVRAQAVPLRHPSGGISGVVIFSRPAMKRGTQREHDRFGLLERIGDRLAGSLELEATLSQVTHTLVPQFADHCLIDLFENDKLVRRVSTHAGGWEPPKGTWAAIGEPIVYPEGHFAEKAMRRQETVVVEDFQSADFPAPSVASAEICRETALTSVIAAPLCARGELLGVMCLALSGLSLHEDPHYDTFDRDFVGAIASRVAIAIDNAMLFEAERRTALAFQTALLPREIPQLDGLNIAWRYFAAKPLETHGQGIQTQVGGDWYDVIPLSAGRVGIVIGDVEGRGARAAAMMGQLRAALRAFAQDDKSPSDILRKLDEWVRILAPPEPDAHGVGVGRSPIVTCTYMVYDAWSRQLSFANAGHDAPLLVINGEVGRLEMSEPGVPLGVRDKGVGGDVMFTEETRTLPPGATLILYTDGLVERRPRDDADGEYWDEDVAVRMLRARVAESAHLDVEGIATAAADAVPGDIDDDVAILVIRAEEQDLAVDERTFPAQPIMVSEARRMAAETLERWKIGDDQADLACLLVSEVVTNVVLHASIARTPRREMVLEGVQGPALYDEDPWSLPELTGLEEPERDEEKRFRLRLRRGATSIWVEVFDSDLRLPRLRNAGENDEGGRGLYLVDQLTNRWGSRPTKDGKAVWFEIPIQ
ncbi:MAG TPA: SpoIIE family protein phosphatase [Streptosporangiaceae bacterium]|jgi:PAS domain S-box-containing protein